MNNEEITVVRTASCPSISGKSTIGYDIGSLGNQQFIRLSGNSSGGIFCREWISQADVQLLLKGVPQPTAKTLRPLYMGKSANSPGFLLACAIHENLAGNITATETTLPKSSSPKPAKKKPAQEA